jgi:hypothetical protein
MEQFALSAGYEGYFIQSSLTDQKRGRKGCRSYYWAKDLTTTPYDFEPSDNSLLAIVDVDQYIDMTQLLVSQFKPTILYTVQPDQVAKVAKEYTYTFNSNNELVYRVTGGGEYIHPLWNYGQDHILLSQSICGITYIAASYLIDRRSTSPDHELVLLTPMARYTGFSAILASFLFGKTLKRYQPVQGKFLRLETHGTTGTRRSTGSVGEYAQSNVTIAQDDTIKVLSRTSKLDLTVPQAMALTGMERAQVLPLVEYHRLGVNHDPTITFPLEVSLRRYQFEPEQYDPEARPLVIPFMNPLLPECFAPDQTAANERQCVQGRIADVKSELNSVSPFLLECMQEFVAFVVPIPFCLTPLEEEEVYLRQNRPTQRRILDLAQYEEPERVVKMFIKKEPYQNPKDPRPISTINGPDKAEYSRYMYAISDMIKWAPWYAFGTTPDEVAKKVADICSNADSVTDSDGNRWDGRVSYVMRELEKLLLLRAFTKIDRIRAVELHQTQIGIPCVGTYGTKYESGFARLSGSPETAVFNSVDNKFISYVGQRMTYPHKSPFECYEMPGIYGGDDGLTADIDPKMLGKAAKMMGQVYTMNSVKRGSFGVTFLARIYGPDVWFGDPNSCCDLPRQLAKLHVTVALPKNVSPADKLVEKARSFYLTDSNTPILGHFVNKAVEIYGGVPEATEETRPIRAWNSHLELEVQYPNRYDDWMLDYAKASLPDMDLDKFCDWISAADSLDYLLRAPIFAEPKPAASAVPVVVDGDVLLPLPKGNNVKQVVEGKKSEPNKEQGPAKKGRSKRGRKDAKVTTDRKQSARSSNYKGKKS